MSLATRATTAPTRRINGTPCSIGELLTTLPKAESAALQTMLDAPWRVWPHNHIEDAIRGEGYVAGSGQVGKHRRKTCRCFKEPS